MDCEYVLIKIISEYKKILKRHLSCQESCAKIQELGIKRKDLRNACNAQLMHKVNLILQDINQLIATKDNNPTNYCGLSQFANHIQRQINDHILTDRMEIINAQKITSKAVIEAIQLISADSISSHHLNKLQNNIQTAIKYGSYDQKQLLIKALKAHADANHSIFFPLIHLVESNTDQLAS